VSFWSSPCPLALSSRPGELSHQSPPITNVRTRRR
jgi:hypothetical protein